MQRRRMPARMPRQCRQPILARGQPDAILGPQIGGAQVSPKHANFFVNTGDATAAQLAALIRLARREVLRQFGVLLTPEVRLIGPWPDDALSPTP